MCKWRVLRIWIVCAALALASCAPALPRRSPTPQRIIIRPEDGMPPTRAPATVTAATPAGPTDRPPVGYPLPTPTATPTGTPAAYP